MGNLAIRKKTNLSSFRRIAIGTWKTAFDPTVYGSITLPMDETLRYMAEFREKTGRRITLTHMMARAVAAVLEAMPDANAILRFNNIYLRDNIGVFFQVALQDEETGEMDLSGATIHHANEKTVLEIYDEFQDIVSKVRSGKDKELEGTRSMFKKIPSFLLNKVLNTIGFLSYTLNLNLKFLGVPKDPFGSCMVTNVGSLGLEEAYVPLVPYSRVPLLIAVGTVKEMPFCHEGEVKIRKEMKCFATFDHRILDGSHAAKMSKVLKAWFEDPYGHFGPIPDDTSSTTNETAALPEKSKETASAA
ncbi:MAG: 2-oxo acid dehydrogenase subunit E2 [Deltaproteobacteria bacterium]|nr:2-oxo acid dehydrogenase subunit E2 [Deltaproteobacteria bacterium]